MPQMSPIVWMVYPYVMMMVMMIFVITFMKEEGEFKGGEGSGRGVGMVVLW